MQKHIERVNYTLRIYYTAARVVQPLFDLSGPRFPTRLADTWDTKNNLRVASSRTAAVDRQVFTERFNILTIVLTGMSLIIAAVGSLGLTDSLTISGMERRREIGLMRAIGGSDRAVLQIF